MRGHGLLWMLVATLAACHPKTDTATSFPVPTPVGFVNDFAKILPDSSVRQATAIITDVKNSTKGEIAVITVPSLKGHSAFDASLTIARAWKVGWNGPPDDPRSNNGVLILIAPADHQIWIQLSDKANTFISNDEAKRIAGQVMAPLCKQQDCGDAVVAGVTSVANHFKERFGTTPK